MTSARASGLIAAFQSAHEQGGESNEKIEVLRELEQLTEPEVTRFLTAVVANPGEYDLARIEALKILESRRFSVDDAREPVVQSILSVLATDEDDEVRAYAARSLANFTDVPGAVDVAGRLVLDPDEDLDVRHNAFFCA